MRSSREDVARMLARAHSAIEPSITQVYRITKSHEKRADDPITLLEVNEATLRCGIVPVYFRAHPESGLDYPAEIVEVTPDEFEDIRNGTLALPDGWAIGELIAPEEPTAAGMQE